MAHPQFSSPAILPSSAPAWPGPNHLVITIATCAGLLLICFLRRPEMFLMPQLWAEDGPIFFVQADADGVRTLFRSYAGYLHLLPRLMAATAAALPAGWIPSAYFTASMGALVAVGAALFSPRIDLPWKPALTLAPALVPHSGEAIGNLTNLQWVVALALVWLLIARDAATLRQHCTDLLVAAVVGLTGVFSTILTPFFVWRAIQRRTIASSALASVICLAGGWQAWTVFHSTPTSSELIRLNPTTGAQIVALRTGASLLLTPSLAEQLSRRFLTGAGVLNVAGLLAIALWPGRQQPTRFALAASSLCIAAATLYRFRHGDFDALFSLSMGDRYFFLPKVMMLWLLIWGAAQGHAVRWLAATACGAALVAAGLNWQYERWQDFHWTDYAARIQTGERINDIPLNPHGFKFDYPGHHGGR